MDLARYIKSIPDYPREGIVFKDITPLFLEPKALRRAVDEMSAYADRLDVDLVVSELKTSSGPRIVGSRNRRQFRDSSITMLTNG